MTPLIVAILTLQLADVVTTWYALERSQGLSEGNPVVRWLMDRLGTIGALAAVKAPLVGLVVAYGSTVHPYALFAVLLAYTAVVTNNIYHIFK